MIYQLWQMDKFTGLQFKQYENVEIIAFEQDANANDNDRSVDSNRYLIEFFLRSRA